ncbi:CGNR zinc finger domain-containing protein [Streptomyces scopuliridis]
MIKRCEQHTFGGLFVDAGRGRRRRWCSMSTCGYTVRRANLKAARETVPRPGMRRPGDTTPGRGGAIRRPLAFPRGEVMTHGRSLPSRADSSIDGPDHHGAARR